MDWKDARATDLEKACVVRHLITILFQKISANDYSLNTIPPPALRGNATGDGWFADLDKLGLNRSSLV